MFESDASSGSCRRWVRAQLGEQCRRLNWRAGELLSFAGRRKLLTVAVAAAPGIIVEEQSESVAKSGL